MIYFLPARSASSETLERSQMTPEIVRRLAYRYYLSFLFTGYLESNRGTSLIVWQFSAIWDSSSRKQKSGDMS